MCIPVYFGSLRRGTGYLWSPSYRGERPLWWALRKRQGMTLSGEVQGGELKRTTDRCRNEKDDIRNGGFDVSKKRDIDPDSNSLQLGDSSRRSPSKSCEEEKGSLNHLQSGSEFQFIQFPCTPEG